jgi:predicted nucleotidyltransferase
MTELNASEQAAVTRYIELVQQRLGHQLETVWLYGSAARDDMWPTDSPMHSDIDVLVVTSESVTQDQVDQLVNDTYPLYLECGRQISPAFKTAREWRSEDDKAEFVARVRDEGRQLWPQPRNDLAPSTGGPALPSKRRAGFREAMPHHAPAQNTPPHHLPGIRVQGEHG